MRLEDARQGICEWAVDGDKREEASRRLNKDDSAGDWTIAEQRRLRLKTIDWTIAPAMKYVDSLSRVGGDLRAPRNRFTAYFRCVLIADRPGCDPCRHAPLNIFHCRIYKVELP